jgi:hypothetical protein
MNKYCFHREKIRFISSSLFNRVVYTYIILFLKRRLYVVDIFVTYFLVNILHLCNKKVNCIIYSV